MNILRRLFNFISCNKCKTDLIDIAEIIECHTCQYCYDMIACSGYMSRVYHTARSSDDTCTGANNICADIDNTGKVNKTSCPAPIYYISRRFQNDYNEINILERKYIVFTDKDTGEPFIICSYCYNKLKEKTLIKTKGQVYKVFKREELQYQRLNTILEDFGLDYRPIR